MSGYFTKKKKIKKNNVMWVLNPAYSGEICCGYVHHAIMRYVNFWSDLSLIFAENGVW